MSIRHNDFIGNKESNMIKDIVFDSMVNHNAFDKKEKEVLKRNKDELYQGFNHGLDVLFVDSLNYINDILRFNEED